MDAQHSGIDRLVSPPPFSGLQGNIPALESLAGEGTVATFPLGAVSLLLLPPSCSPGPAEVVVTNTTGSTLTQPVWGTTSPAPVSAVVPGEVGGITQHTLDAHSGMIP